tara:strand:- start:12325 stop:13020 length:696 start_codon:yes stop_codon:yes gene_type:complete
MNGESKESKVDTREVSEKTEETYEKLSLYIKEQGFAFNIDNEPLIDEFANLIDEEPIHVANCVLNTPEHFPLKIKKNGEPYKTQREYLEDEPNYEGKKIDYKGVSPEWKQDDIDWLYLLTYNGHVVKIGMTITSLEDRYGSYSCGTTRAMKKGSCSTTNFIISECNYMALRLGINVKIYGIPCPPTLTKKSRFGITKMCRSSTVRDEETMLTEKFVDTYKHKPVLCVQKGK